MGRKALLILCALLCVAQAQAEEKVQTHTAEFTDIDEQRVVTLAERAARGALDAKSTWNQSEHKLSFRHYIYGVKHYATIRTVEENGIKKVVVSDEAHGTRWGVTKEGQVAYSSKLFMSHLAFSVRTETANLRPVKIKDFEKLRNALVGHTVRPKVALSVWREANGSLVFPPGRVANPGTPVTITSIVACRSYPDTGRVYDYDNCGNPDGERAVLVVLFNGAVTRKYQAGNQSQQVSGLAGEQVAGLLYGLGCALGSSLNCVQGQLSGQTAEQIQTRQELANVKAELQRQREEAIAANAGPEIVFVLSEESTPEQVQSTLENYIEFVQSPVAQPGVTQTPSSYVPPFAPDAVTVIIKSTPDGAEVVFDSKYIGTTPSMLQVKAATVPVKLVMPGYRTWERTITLMPGAAITINATLEKKEGD